MIYVTAGHEKGIGIEVFIKSYLMLHPADQDLFHFITNRSALGETLDVCNMDLENDPLRISYVYDRPYSSSALAKSLKTCKENDVLITMPTSKDQLKLKDKSPAGHTEYFRQFFDTDVAMFFKAYDFNVLLVSDHIPLKDVTNITAEQIHDKVSLCLVNYEKYFNKINKVIISGFNPHAGEDGILGYEDKKVGEAIYTLTKEFSQEFIGPLPADSILLSNEPHEDTLFVYLYHDQGLGPFKSLHKTAGANISFGLPFLRLSVDHGTARELYGQNKADYMGCYHVLKMAINAHKRINPS